MISERAKLDGYRQHPWLEEFAASPQSETARLLAGLANIGSLGRADPSDAATVMFDTLPEQDRRRDMLGKSLVIWLNERRVMPLRDRAIYGLDSFVREVSDAFRIIWRLGLTDAARELRKNFESWDSWARPLMLTPARDARRAFLRLCALMQTALDDSQLEPVWLSLCKMAGRELFPAYLDVGLLGLRRMPSREFGADPAARAAMGLAVWAKSIRPSRSDFLKEWRALKGLYVRPPGVFVNIVNAALDATEKGGRERFQAAEWWRREIKANKLKAKSHQQLRLGAPPTRGDVDEIVRQFKRLGITEEVLAKIDSVMKRHERYASDSSDTYFLVRGAGILTSGLIASGDKRATEIAMRIIRRTLSWNINDAHTWSLWQRTLTLSGDRKGAEDIGWEAIRRFPENPVLRSQLSGFLATNPERQAEAWALITETVNRFPDEGAWTQLALLMRNMPGRKLDLEKLLREAMNKLPESLIIRNFHASALLSLGKTKEAGHELDTLRREFKGRLGPAYHAIRVRWAFQTGGADLAKMYLMDALKDYPEDFHLREKFAALLDTGTIEEEEEEFAPASSNDGVDSVDADSFETNDVTRTSSAQKTLSGSASTPQIGEDSIVDLSEATERSEPNENIVPIAEEARIEGFEIAPIEEMADEDPMQQAETPKSAVTQEVKGPESIEPQRMIKTPAKKIASNSWTAPLIDTGRDEMINEALRYGRAKRIDYALNGAGLNEEGRAIARDDLNRLLDENETFGYGYLVNLRRVDAKVDDQLWQGLGHEEAIFLQQAWQTRDIKRLNDLVVEGRETLLVKCARALLGDEGSLREFAESISAYPGREGRGSRALRLVLSGPLERGLGRNADLPQKSLSDAVQELVVNESETVEQALTDAIDASFDYFGTEQWVNARKLSSADDNGLEG
jgi:hypothetical protein